MIFRSRWLAVTASLLCLALFALQPWSYIRYPDGKGLLFTPLTAASALACGLVSAHGFPRRPWIAALCAAISVGLFSWGNTYADAAFDNLFGGPLSWWGEKVAGMQLLLGVPAILIAAAIGFLVSRSFKRTGAADID